MREETVLLSLSNLILSVMATVWARVRRGKIWLRLLLLGCCLWVTGYSLRRYFTADVRKINWNTIFYRSEVFSTQTQYTGNGDPVNHIAFLKVPKAASTTVQNIFLRYGDEKNLVFALPRVRPAGGLSLTSRYFYPPLNNRTYDITCAHVRYNRLQFSKVLHNDTKYIGIVREPFNRFKSSIRFFHPTPVLRIPGNNPVLEYLSGAERYTKLTGNSIKMCNTMSEYFGFPEKLYQMKHQLGIGDYLLKLDKEMDIVLVLEYLDESIVLMRRMLNWDLRHVLYAKLRVNKEEDPRLKFGSTEESLYKECGYIDYRLYHYFVNKLRENIKAEKPDFHDEVAYFKKTREKYDAFCLSTLSEVLDKTEMAFDGSPWNRPFVITSEHCEKTFIHDVEFIKKLVKKQHSWL